MQKIIKYLKELKKINAVAVKQSLEDEGVSYEDLIVMKKITQKANLDLNVKIGGCEAKNDIYFCEWLKVKGIVAPMVESSYALRKFLQTISKKNKQKLYVNLESIQAFKNIDKILGQSNINKLTGVVIGRSDLAGSLNLEKKKVDSKRIYNLVFQVLKKIKKKKLIVKMGGSLTAHSKNFVTNLFKKNLIDRVETRNIELKINYKILNNFENAINSIFRFELEWLKFKQLLQKKRKIKLKNDNLDRIKILKKRFN
jgi:4-hydroxy-2-oxoheptanedioate aldolase